MRTRATLLLAVLLTFTLSACEAEPDGVEGMAATTAPDERLACAPDNGGLQLPEGFCAVLVADSVGRGRHIAVNENGDIYLKLRSADGGGIAALRDEDGDGQADTVERFGDFAGTGIEIHNGYLYASSDTSVHRYRLDGTGLMPMGEPETVVSGFPVQRSHASKSFAIDGSGNLYVNSGAPSNSCQEQEREAGSMGQDPCPMLDRTGGIWRFSVDELGQTQMDDGTRFATGIRNLIAITWNPNGGLYGVQHGRDMLFQNWGELYTAEQSAQLPAEEFFSIDEGDDFGWPYCYYDQVQDKKVLAPEYGGDGGNEVGRCDEKEDPLIGFPGHYAPNDLVFYTAEQFPAKYRDGAFIAFHGSWNRAPLEQDGYNVVFVPFDGANPSGDWEVFADDFAGVEPIASTGDAEYRPTGLALGPDGSLYISDSVQGRIWRVIYRGA